MLEDFFQQGPIPTNAMSGTYDLKLVALSYIIAVLASYVALDLAGRLRSESNASSKPYWLIAGAFAMGAGIWSMHFIGMLAFQMQMPMEYNSIWTAGSFLAAFFASLLALYILWKKTNVIYTFLGGILIGLGIATMHYMGMEAMTNDVNIHYIPSIFILSLLIAIFASEAALWLAAKSNEGSIKYQFNLKIISALIMGVAICGMHYTGMYAAVFTPTENMSMTVAAISPNLLALFIAGITAIIICLTLTISSYYKRMITAIQNEKDFLNAMLDNLEDGIIACDNTGKITVINDALLHRLGIEKCIIPKDFSEYCELYKVGSEYPIKKNEYPLHRALNGEKIETQEYVVKFKDSEETRDISINGQPIINARGENFGAVLVIRDITDIKKTDKLKREFVSVVSHELRTPLTSIRGSIGLLLGGAAGDFSIKANTLLEIANKNCDRLLLLINDILDMEKLQADKMTFDLAAVNIVELATDAISINKAYADKYNIKLRLEIDVPDDTFVYADSGRLLQVFTNLLSNASKFSETGETVKLHIHKLNEQVRISFTNKGVPIPVEFQTRIFQKFSQADSTDTRGKGGSGLGLSISKAITEKLGGNLSFTSNAIDGTTFNLDLPIHHTSNVQTNNPQLTHSSRLLICAQNEEKVGYLKKMLKDVGFDVEVAVTATKTKELLRTKKYNTILLDALVADQDGIGLVRELRKLYKTTELSIIICAFELGTNQDSLHGDAFVVLDWLDSPMNFNKLLEVITELEHDQAKNLPRILHVEDDADTKHVVATILETEATIVDASTIHEAIHLMGHEEFDLVILDLLLPDGNAAELLPIFSKYNLPIIVYSAFELDKEYTKYVSQALVKSNISNDKILSIIKNLLARQSKKSETVE